MLYQNLKEEPQRFAEAGKNVRRGKYCGKGGDSDLLDARGELLLKGVGSTPCICLGMVFLIMSVMVHGEILNLAAFATTDLCELVYVALGISITVYF